jgi:glutamate synthase (NADPH/NADH) small chain
MIPNFVGKKVAVIREGNVSMDAARIEEVHHAKEEDIMFNMLTNPAEIIGNENGWVSGMRCKRMELGEPDASGRRSPKEIPNSDFVLDVDMVIMSIGTSPNPLIAATTPHLDTNKWGTIVADDDGITSKEGVFAGGDAVSGAATVILAMGAGRKAAKAIDEYIKKKS